VKFSVNKATIAESDPSLDFQGIGSQVSKQRSETETFAREKFGPQIWMSDNINTHAQDFKDDYKKPPSPMLYPNTLPSSFANNPKGFILRPPMPKLSNLLDKGMFSIDGSLVVRPERFTVDSPAFFRKSRRTTTFRKMIHLRGGRYTISANPTFELRQKLDTYREDFNDGLDQYTDKTDYIYRIATADYIKNAVLTMVNSFLYEEKIGHYQLDKISYQSLRKDAQRLAQAAVELFYGTLCRATGLSSDGFNYLDQNRRIFEKLQEHILDEYKKGVFSSRHMTRPEASHPLVIAGAALRFAHMQQPPDVLIGLPAGSTELALAQSTAFRMLKGAQVKVILLPVSLHSIKLDFDNKYTNIAALKRFLAHRKKELDGKKVSIVDDNSSTGQTLQMAADALRPLVKFNPEDINIAESDIVRSSIDQIASDRLTVTNRECFSHSVNVLPVSRRIRKKADLRQLTENSKMVSCIRQRYDNDQGNLARLIIGQVYVDLILNPTELVLPTLDQENTIGSFRKTFLSNFEATPIKCNGREFLSVEHAYQAMKFTENALANVTDQHVEAINRRLLERGVTIGKDSLPHLFSDPDFTAGTSKIAANQLRILGYVRNDWDYVKSEIMSQLLIQKFANPSLFQKLSETNGKYLIEGNDWGDTYWGVCDKRGRNSLGRMLMEIRSRSREVLSDAAKNQSWEFL
jgi:predicted NAD-dependent protein-ADP-ribosyltransferase YbiA (DUF1768 family)/hypoxanthine phosphoribosyltransferase